MAYEKQHHLIEEVLQDLRHAPADWRVNIPWLPGYHWDNAGRAAATVTLSEGRLGVTKNEKGKFKFYYGQRNAGNPFCSVWSAWKSTFIVSPLMYLVFAGWYAGKTSGIANALGMLAGALMIVLFVGRIRTYPLGVYRAIGTGGHAGAVWGALAACVIGANALWGGLLRVLSGHLSYSGPINWPTVLFWSPEEMQRGLGGIIFGVPANLFGIAMILLVIRFGAAFMEGGSFGYFNMFYTSSASARARVPADVYYAGGCGNYDGSGRPAVSPLGLIISVLFFIFLSCLWLFYGK